MESKYQLYHGDCLEVLKTLPDCSVDAVVTDPPYGLSFMGKRWDYDVPAVEVWQECLRVLKPGGHLLAFAGTRTQHRMAVRIEDAGFEIRDLIAWVYGSGFPKSLDVSKAIDREAGAEREVVETRKRSQVASEGWDRPWRQEAMKQAGSTVAEFNITAPATEAAKQWQGWGTALKPAFETVTVASKPLTDRQKQLIIQSNLFQLEAKLWLLSNAKLAEANSASSRLDYEGAFRIAQWTAEKLTNTQADLCGQMDMSRFELATSTSLSIALSWRRILDEALSNGSTFITETKSGTTIDWKILSFSLSQITPESIIRACSLPGGFSVNASTAEKHFNASLLLLQSIRTLSATGDAISQEQIRHQGEGVKPSLDPCIMARKPFASTVAANVLEHGTGGLNVDGCRVGFVSSSDMESAAAAAQRACQDQNKNRTAYGNFDNGPASLQPYLEKMELGRWPANFIHDGSDEATGLLGDAARFFYTAKASKADRDAGCGEFAPRQTHNRKEGGRSTFESSDRIPSRNHHPTVKPTDLMRYLCRLVTPPGGIVLDPFTGSGSTGKAAILEGFRFIGIEREAEYIEIARARIEREAERPRQPTLFD